MLAALLPLQRLTSAGLAVLLLHHTRKAARDDGRSARGSTALTGFVDVLMELHFHRRAADVDRRRRLLAWSRFQETPRRQVIELSEDGREYKALGDIDTVDGAASVALLQRILGRAQYRMTQQRILEEWPEGHERPAPITLWRWLSQEVESGRILRDGAGHKSDPYKYRLPDSDARWAADPDRVPELEGLNERDLAAACGNVLRYNRRIERKRRRQREKREQQRQEEQQQTEETTDESTEPRCFPFGEEARWIR